MSAKKFAKCESFDKKIDENRKDNLLYSTCKYWSPGTALESNEVITQPYRCTRCSGLIKHCLPHVDTYHNQHELIKSDYPSDKISIIKLKQGGHIFEKLNSLSFP